jgi:hypothetical protein
MRTECGTPVAKTSQRPDRKPLRYRGISLSAKGSRRWRQAVIAVGFLALLAVGIAQAFAVEGRTGDTASSVAIVGAVIFWAAGAWLVLTSWGRNQRS